MEKEPICYRLEQFTRALGWLFCGNYDTKREAIEAQMEIKKGGRTRIVAVVSEQ